MIYTVEQGEMIKSHACKVNGECVFVEVLDVQKETLTVDFLGTPTEISRYLTFIRREGVYGAAAKAQIVKNQEVLAAIRAKTLAPQGYGKPFERIAPPVVNQILTPESSITEDLSADKNITLISSPTLKTETPTNFESSEKPQPSRPRFFRPACQLPAFTPK